jgi:hypothetical protein
MHAVRRGTEAQIFLKIMLPAAILVIMAVISENGLPRRA